MSSERKFFHHPLFWVPSLYLAMGIPFNVINNTASTMFKSLGISDAQNTVALGNIILMWSLKPFWAAFLDMYKTKRFFVLSMEFASALLFVGVAMSLPLDNYFKIVISLLWVASFASATQDICGDGIYLTSLSKPKQASLAGVQGMAWNLGKVLATGLFISSMEDLGKVHGWSTQTMWTNVWLTCAGVMAFFTVYHYFILPPGSTTERPESAKQVVHEFLHTAETFFHKRAFWGMIAFVFLYRSGEGLIMSEGKLFLQSTIESGGLGLSAGQVAHIDAVWGTIASITGGILGGLFLGKIGLRKSLWILGLCLNIPHFTFVYLSQQGAWHHGLDYQTIAILVSIEKFGYGFGFIGNMVYMMQQFAPGRFTMTHYAFATSLMNLVLVPTTMISGPLAEWLGFSTFFFVVMFASVPSVWAAWKAPFPLDDKDGGHPEDGKMVITPDDPTRLSAGEQVVQKIAGVASIYAILHILTILIVDAWALGQLQGHKAGVAWFPLAVLSGSAALKLFLTVNTFKHATRASLASAAAPGNAYLANAGGAKKATWLCLAVGAVILVFAFRLGT
ncbi:MFS transporter [Nibricoccus sp. IMCC34717]|uniref:MFS transporter n=1 Tax=Nibricoccus sp. IMCC34717 TaxID=3034021 RepID=UPI00384B8E38